MYLRIAPELYLKRLVVGGMPRVFEVARCFRNEGIDTQHNPEFTQIELYIAYFDFTQLMAFTEKLLSTAIQKTLGSNKISFQGNTLDFTPPYPRKTFAEIVLEHTQIDILNLGEKALLEAVKKKGIKVEKSWGRGKILDELFKKYARPHIKGPLFITHHPLVLSPLAKKDPTNDQQVERFQLLVEGMEMLNGFSELNDPIDQIIRFDEQEKLRSQGDEEAQFADNTYVESLEYGLPPTAGIGIGIDRFMQLLTDTTNIKEVILFPTLRDKS
jgi:lysyl-tRNA synthetase class 2